MIDIEKQRKKDRGKIGSALKQKKSAEHPTV